MIKFDLLFILRRAFLFILLFSTLRVVGVAQTVSTHTPDDSLTVGEVFDLSITLNSASPYTKIIFPDSISFGPSLEFISQQQFKVSDYSDSIRYKLQFFGIEDISIPPLPVRIITEVDTLLVFTESFQLVYKQTITSQEDPLKPLKPIFPFPRTIWPYFAVLLLLLVAGYFIWARYFKEKEAEPIQPRTIPVFENPVVELENILNSIKEKHTNTPEKNYKEFYSELGDALRWYIEELYKIPALESTTREVLRYMDAFGVDVEMVKHTRKVLNEADMTKFAKFKPTLDQSWKAFHEAYSFLDRTRIVDRDRIERIRQEFENRFSDMEEVNDGMG